MASAKSQMMLRSDSTERTPSCTRMKDHWPAGMNCTHFSDRTKIVGLMLPSRRIWLQSSILHHPRLVHDSQSQSALVLQWYIGGATIRKYCESCTYTGMLETAATMSDF